MTPRPLFATLAVAAVALTLAACGEKQDNVSATPAVRHVTLILDYFPNADHVGIYNALARGDFKRAGLDVKIVTPSDPSAPLKLLAAGKADLAITYEPELLLARDKGLKVVSVAALATAPLTSIIALGSAKISSPADLSGKKVGTAGIPYQSAYLRTIAQKAGLDPSKVKEINVGFDLVPAMLSKKVDATLGGFWNYEGVQLARERKHPTIIRMDQAGVPTYDELVVAARTSYLHRDGETVRRFVQALQTGTLAARADPRTAVDNLVSANKDLNRGLQTAAVAATLPVLFPAQANKPFGWQDTTEWQAYSSWMFDNKLVSTPPTAAAFTNEFLPGQGVTAVGD